MIERALPLAAFTLVLAIGFAAPPDVDHPELDMETPA